MKRDNQNKSIDAAICEKLYRIAEEVLDFASTDVVVDNYQKGEYENTHYGNGKQGVNQRASNKENERL